MRRLFVLTTLLFALPVHAVTIDWVTVGDPGNACEVQPPLFDIPGGCFGSVGYNYRISKYEITNAQYAEFLNGVAKTDTYNLYSTTMGSGYGGITQSGSSGSYMYSAIAGRENMPVNFVSFWDGLRFANWLDNGQPTGAQDSSTTEDGAYTITAQGIADNSITRNADATIFLTSEDEWYKAAYYDAVSTSYFDYPARSDVPTTCAAPGATSNTANCDNVVGDLTDVGNYTGSPSPYGTFDQGGNVWEWNEAIISTSYRGVRGGGFGSGPGRLQAAVRGTTAPWGEQYVLGARFAMVPEPTTAVLFATGLAGLAMRRHPRSRCG